ncbi:MAG TPA: hypothetical protein VHZ26_02025 [Caulobacteraceae bacterium]|jgi:hypothetical protein|nr:hypothetical protein [Caulobacteraceae bacterium]
MRILTVSPDSQLALDDDLLKHLSVRPGEQVAIEALPDGRIEMKAVRPTGRISDVFGRLKRENGPSLSIDEVSGIGQDGWAGKR